MQFSQEAKILLDQMPNFDKEDFKAWWERRMVQVGSRNILEYLHEKDLQKQTQYSPTKINK